MEANKFLELGWWMAAAVAAFFVKGLCGFANTLVFTTILSFGNNNISISPVELLLGYPSNLIMAYQERKSIEWRLCMPLAVLVIAGSLPGIFLLANGDAKLIKVLFGFLIVIVGLEMLGEYKEGSGKKAKAVLIFIGVLSGLLCGLYGVGALLGAYMSRVTDGSHEFKANICVVFLVENTLRIMFYAVCGILTFSNFIQAVKLAPFMVAGLYLGIACSRRISETIVKKLVIIMLIVSGIALIIKNL